MKPKYILLLVVMAIVLVTLCVIFPAVIEIVSLITTVYYLVLAVGCFAYYASEFYYKHKHKHA